MKAGGSLSGLALRTVAEDTSSGRVPLVPAWSKKLPSPGEATDA
jgi:hypothetical protein